MPARSSMRKIMWMARTINRCLKRQVLGITPMRRAISEASCAFDFEQLSNAHFAAQALPHSGIFLKSADGTISCYRPCNTRNWPCTSCTLRCTISRAEIPQADYRNAITNPSTTATSVAASRLLLSSVSREPN